MAERSEDSAAFHIIEVDRCKSRSRIFGFLSLQYVAYQTGSSLLCRDPRGRHTAERGWLFCEISGELMKSANIMFQRNQIRWKLIRRL